MSPLILVRSVSPSVGLSRSTSSHAATFPSGFSSGFATCLSSQGPLPYPLECIGAVSVVLAEVVARPSTVTVSTGSGAACCSFRAVRRFTCPRRTLLTTLMLTVIVRPQSFSGLSLSVPRCARWHTCGRYLPRQQDSGYRRHMNQSPNHALHLTRPSRSGCKRALSRAGSLSSLDRKRERTNMNGHNL
ncbi:MAG: hypothetical protein JWR69_3383 [Pedosphaera sp.]|nr:hypothetical protein [Pedosphaera sp.]